MIAIEATTFGGIDWHDCTITNQFLKEKFKSTYDIAPENINKVIAQDIYKTIKGAFTTVTEYKGKITVKRELESLPTFEQILKAVENKETIRLTSKLSPDTGLPETELGVEVKDGVFHVYREYVHGNVSYETDYVVYDIPDDKVGYIVSENFLCPTKGVPSISRFYHEAYDNLADAKLAMKKMKLHKDYDSVKEMYIANMDEMREREWYKKNINAIGKPFQLFLSHSA